jgi:hypothetical protein
VLDLDERRRESIRRAIMLSIDPVKRSSIITRTVFYSMLVFPLVLQAQSKPPCDSGEPCIEFAFVPPYRSRELLRGLVRNVENPADYKVCPYIRVEGGWWTKPSFDTPCVQIDPVNGTWAADITTGGQDEYALEIVAFLLPRAVNPPQRTGECRLPSELDVFPRSYADRTGSRRTISFAGYDWTVKDLRWGPGPNDFSDSTENVWVDDLGQLHMRITRREGRWFAAEVISRDVFGYGTYSFSLGNRVDQLNENVVFGLFTWDNDACASNYNEIDIEFSRFSRVDDQNSQYVVQPFDTCGIIRFDMPGVDSSTHMFDWEPDRVDFLSFQGPDLIQSWEFGEQRCIPAPINGNARINLWLFRGVPPSDGQEVEVLITDFQFTPSSSS